METQPAFEATGQDISATLEDTGQQPLRDCALYIEKAERQYQGSEQVWNIRLIQYTYMPSFEVKPHVVCRCTLDNIPYRHQNPDKQEMVALIRQALSRSDQLCRCYTFTEKVDAEVFIRKRQQS